MQTTSSQFDDFAQGHVRPLSWELRASFDKTFDAGIDFFTLDTSLLDGTDVLAPADNNVITLWDKYAYADYSDRVISMEVTREVVEPYSIVQSYADITLNNYDDYFTPNSGSPIDAFILPKRPFRILMGFGGESLPLFVGLSERMPDITKNSRTASFHLIDFLTFIFEKEIGESTMLLDYSTSEIINELFLQVGLTANQYDLDNSFNRIPFFFVEKGDKLGTIIRDLMQAEQGRLYMDELGIIRFLNRQNYDSVIDYTFNKSNTIDYKVGNEDDIINSVKLRSNILQVQQEQSIWEQSLAEYVGIGATVEIWAQFENPVTAVTTPFNSPISVEASHFIATTDSDGTIPYTDMTLNSIDVFGKSAKLTFENTGSSNAYVYSVDLWGTPVKAVDTILVEDFDQTSIDQFEERVYSFETNYIQTKNDALTKAAILIDDYKDYGSIVELDVKGNTALQIDDVIDLDLDGYQGEHIVTKIINGMADGRYWQRLVGKSKDVRQYFILDQSLLDGTDVLSP